MSATDPAAATAAATAAADVLSNPHLLAAILEQLARASDLAHATAVSTAWCQEGCANALWRAHCLRSFPQLAGLLVAGFIVKASLLLVTVDITLFYYIKAKS